MSQPIVIPPVQTPEERFRQAMQDPAVRNRAANDPLFAARLREALMNGPMFSEGPSVNPRDPRTFSRPAVSTTFAGLGVAPVGVSVADQVRMQRDAFLVTDGSQVAGNYDTAIRAAKGGIPAPRTPRVGSPSAFYPYPGDNMRTGAALAGNGVMATETRGLLPTTGYNPGAFVATRPDSLNRTLATNVPVPMPRQRIPSSTTRIITSSPSEERRKSISTLLGLGATPNPKGVDPRRGSITSFDLLQDFLDNDADFRRTAQGKIVAPALAATFGLLAVPKQEMMDAAQKAFWGFDKPIDATAEGVLRATRRTVYYILLAMQTVVEVIITTLIMAQKFDLDATGIKQMLDQIAPLKSAAAQYGGSYNALINAKMLEIYPEGWGSIIQAMGGQMPFVLEATGVRAYMIRYLYRRIWNTEIPDVVYSAVSSKLACGEILGASVSKAIDLMMMDEYAPNKTPALTSCPAAKVFDPNPATEEGGGAAPEAGGEINMTLVKGGLIAAALLLGVGVYAKTR